MKKFYPDEYFRRAGYEYNPYTSKESVQLKANSNLNTEFARFNEELIYPETGKKVPVQ